MPDVPETDELDKEDEADNFFQSRLYRKQMKRTHQFVGTTHGVVVGGPGDIYGSRNQEAWEPILASA